MEDLEGTEWIDTSTISTWKEEKLEHGTEIHSTFLKRESMFYEMRYYLPRAARRS